ncbi:TlpA family protein disulfide reductase [Thiohalophilus thiocyanatoxydans]|uniref:Peroxiredoxin n=1 Tax=Thiohalophilus thiocyanatoxydans TaxID=381308 RepID=A0A4R8IH94_9GAMM|nr:TlpA disulfide reductase family protein [Thiohalophilus thiocyanatoxydans]TDX99587.1 peroxiredoxin [Thiohalophilus thiocyanatoxydans]
MKRSVFISIIVVVAVISLLAGMYANRLFDDPESNAAAQTAQNKPAKTGQSTDTPEIRPDFGLQDLDDELRHVSEWDGDVLIVNFWATWCPPCRREIPAFIDLQEEYRDQGLTIVGIAIDTKQDTVDFVDPLGINYPILIGEKEGIALSKDYGNRLGVLPYTIIVDRDGKITETHRNELTFEEAEAMIKPLL